MPETHNKAQSKQDGGKQNGAGRKRAAGAKAHKNEKVEEMEAGAHAIALLKADHSRAEQLFAQFQQTNDKQRKAAIAKQVCQELIMHTLLEEEIFYPACRAKMGQDKLNEAQVEHDSAKLLINQILSGDPSAQYYNAWVKVLSEQIRRHVAEEEKPEDGIFAKAKAAGLDTPELAEKLTARKAELTEQAEEEGLERPEPRSFEEDENGPRRTRFAGERPARRRQDEEDDYRRARGRDEDYRGQPDRDEYRRSMRDEDDGERRYARERPRYEDEDRARRRSEDGARDHRGEGGWFGDSEGHARAARRGWETREGYGRPRYEEEDDRGWRRRRD